MKKGKSKRNEILKQRRRNRREVEEEDFVDEERGLAPRRRYKTREFGVDADTLREERGDRRRSGLMRTRSAFHN